MDFDPIPINPNDAHIVDTVPLSYFFEEKTIELKDAVLNVFGNSSSSSHPHNNRILPWNSSILEHHQQATSASGDGDSDSDTHGNFGRTIQELGDDLPHPVVAISSSSPSSSSFSTSLSDSRGPTGRALDFLGQESSWHAQTKRSNDKVSQQQQEQQHQQKESTTTTSSAFLFPQNKKQRTDDCKGIQKPFPSDSHQVGIIPQQQQDDSSHKEKVTSSSASLRSGKNNNQVSKWNHRYEELVQYKQAYGNCNISNIWEPNQGLSLWAKRQRHQYRQLQEGKHSTLTPERLDKLDRIGFIWNIQDTTWEERLQELHQFRLIHGHCKIPTSYPPSPGLAIWAKSQRRHFKMFCMHKLKNQNKMAVVENNNNTKQEENEKQQQQQQPTIEWTSSMMSEERIIKLANVGFVFSNRSSKCALEILTDCTNGRLEDF